MHHYAYAIFFTMTGDKNDTGVGLMMYASSCLNVATAMSIVNFSLLQFLASVGRIAMQSIRCDVMLPMFYGLCVLVF